MLELKLWFRVYSLDEDFGSSETLMLAARHFSP